MPIPVYDATSSRDLNRALTDIEAALAAAPLTPVESATANVTSKDEDTPDAETPDFDIPEFSQLIGIRPEVYEQIRGALKSGKRHLMFYGPPGTGKTSLAELVAGILHTSHKLVTGSADWSSQDVIGGYQPIGDGGIRFTKGVLLEHFDQPLIIDELNRCDIDRVLGPLFTVLSGQPTTLPYLINPADDASERYMILPSAKPDAASYECAPTNNWRLLATINSIDKASLYQLSYALTRRFAWILVDAPADLSGFVRAFAKLKSYVGTEPAQNAPCPLADIWQAVNNVRPMGAAPFIDAMAYCRSFNEDFDFFAPAAEAMRATYLGAFQVFVMPMLDGVAHEQARAVAEGVSAAIRLSEDAEADLVRRLLAMAL